MDAYLGHNAAVEVLTVGGGGGGSYGDASGKVVDAAFPAVRKGKVVEAGRDAPGLEHKVWESRANGCMALSLTALFTLVRSCCSTFLLRQRSGDGYFHARLTQQWQLIRKSSTRRRARSHGRISQNQRGCGFKLHVLSFSDIRNSFVLSTAGSFWDSRYLLPGLSGTSPLVAL